MKLRIKFLVVAFLLCGITRAQVSKESFEKTVDLLNCKTVELSLQGNENLQTFLQRYPCGDSDYTQINQFLTSTGKLDATIALSNEIESLKKSFKDNWKINDVVNFLSESIFTDEVKYKKIFAFAKKRKGDAQFNSYKTNLKTELPTQLVENTPEENVAFSNTAVQQQSSNDGGTESEKSQESNKNNNWFSGITSQIIVVSVIISLLFAFLTLFFASKLFRNDSEVSDNIRGYVKRKINEEQFNKSTFNGGINSSELQDANNRIRDLESQIEQIKKQLSTSSPVTEQTYQETKQPETRTETLYLSSPNSDGSGFDENSASSTYKEGATIYRFTKIGSNRAKFQIDEKDASVKLALQYRDKRIDPVCEAVNAFSQSKGITTVEEGEAELQGNKWIINKKAKIRYEN